MNIVYIDEVGQGSIAGDLYVCAVLDDGQPKIEGVRDSKKLSKKQRNKLYPILTEQLVYSLDKATVKEIEDLNVHHAKYESMRRAVMSLISRGYKIDKVIIDGKFIIPNLDLEQEYCVRSDDIHWQTGAASIIAKVYRDTLMEELAQQEKYSYYDWGSNAGYYSPRHRLGIILHGPCDLHRKNFMYFQYCLDRHRKYNGEDINEFLAKKNGMSDYAWWKGVVKQLTKI